MFNSKLILLLLLYVFQSSLDLDKRSLKFQRMVMDFSYDVERKIKVCDDVVQFKLKLLEDSLSLPVACFRLRSRFVKFIDHCFSICRDNLS